MIARLLRRVSGGRLFPARPTVGVLRLEGVIAARGGIGRRLSLAALAGQIEKVFALPDLSAVALVINSPGGSPAQSALIESRIRQLAAENGLPVIAFAEDVAASGGYWLALAADEIFATAATIVGSIGVVSAGFGFTELLARVGVERRLYTAGEHKALLDPFSPQDPEDVERLLRLQRDLHETFKDHVRLRRGARLAETDELFSGAVFTGRQALALGLIDGIAEMRGEMRRRFGPRVRFKLIGQRRLGWFRQPVPSVETLAAGLLQALDDRALWRRFNL